jgi:hypothetical protein
MRKIFQPAFVFALALLLAAEIFLRATLPPLSVAAFQYGYHPDAGFQENADGTVQLVPGPLRDFNPQQFSRVPAPGVRRIFTLGNSVEYWDGIGSHVLTNTYPARLGAELTRRGLKTESINLGVTSYGLQRNTVLLRKILAYQPSLIIIKLDVTNEGMDESTAARARSFCSASPQDWLWKSYLVQSGVMFKEKRVMDHTLPGRVLLQAFGQKSSRTTNSATVSPFNETSRRTLDDCLRRARAHHVKVLLLTQAYVANDADGRARVTDHGLDEFAAILAGPGVAVFSLTKLLAGLPVAETFTDHIHLTRHAHQIVAEALAGPVARLLDSPLPP